MSNPDVNDSVYVDSKQFSTCGASNVVHQISMCAASNVDVNDSV